MSGPSPAPKPTTGLSIVTANYWRLNTEPVADLAVLVRRKPHLAGVNEGRKFVALLDGIPGYQLRVHGGPTEQNNPILVRDDIEVERSWSKIMCDAVGTSGARAATVVCYTLADVKRAHIQTHTNAHIQEGPNNPHELPRVKEDIRHIIRLEAMVKDLRNQGYRVTVAGDFNWSWSKDDAHDWHYSPEAMADRLGLTTTFDAPSNPPVGTFGSRDIDYVMYDPADLVLVEQGLLSGEHSDHRWPWATFQQQ